MQLVQPRPLKLIDSFRWQCDWWWGGACGLGCFLVPSLLSLLRCKDGEVNMWDNVVQLISIRIGL